MSWPERRLSVRTGAVHVEHKSQHLKTNFTSFASPCTNLLASVCYLCTFFPIVFMVLILCALQNGLPQKDDLIPTRAGVVSCLHQQVAAADCVSQPKRESNTKQQAVRN